VAIAMVTPYDYCVTCRKLLSRLTNLALQRL